MKTMCMCSFKSPKLQKKCFHYKAQEIKRWMYTERKKIPVKNTEELPCGFSNRTNIQMEPQKTDDDSTF